MRFECATIFVRDMEKSLAFYHGLLGLEIVRRNAAGTGELAFLGEKGQPNLELVYQPTQQEIAYSGFSLGFAVESLAEATTLLEQNGYALLRGPISPNAAVRFSFFAGPDGEEIELIEYAR